MNPKNDKSTNDLRDTDSYFVDYAQFEDDASRRADAKHAFINNEVYLPDYRYPKLDQIYDIRKKPLSDQKRDTYEAVLELEARKGSGEMSPELYELYAASHESYLKGMMLVEAAQRIRTASSSSEQETARQEFTQLNREKYGDMDVTAFDAIMHTEQHRVEDFVAKDERSKQIRRSLLRYFDRREFRGEEKVDFTPEELEESRSAIEKRYGDILNSIPDTPDDQYYDADQCAEILNGCLRVSGLAEAGWACVVDPKKANPATDGETKKIKLPVNTRRNANELRRLYLHEGEVHARRALNGSRTGIRPLEKGTATYADVEEGLGVVLEGILTGDLTSSPAYNRARDRYIVAGLALGTDGTPKDGRQTYEIMWRLLALRNAEDGVIDDAAVSSAKQQATVHDDNAFRGTNFAKPGIIYSKLKVYYEGLVKNVQYVKDNIDHLDEALDVAMVGKYNHTDPVERNQILSLAA